MRLHGIVAMVLALAAVARADSVAFTVNYVDAAGAGFNAPGAVGAERRAAMEYAMAKFDGLFEAQYAGETVTIDARFADTSFLGFADSNWYIFGPLPKTATYYPGALTNHLAGFDVQATFFSAGANIDITFANNMIDGVGAEFYLGTDGAASASEYDFVTVALHEVMHGLGMLSLVEGATGDFSFLTPAYPHVFDHYVFDPDSGKTLAEMTTSERQAAIVGGNLVWIGPESMAANGGAPIPLYNPNSFVQGSSISHWDESAFPDELMTPFLNSGQAIHEFSALDRAMLTDIGWNVNPPVPEPGSWVMVGGAAIVAAVIARRRKRAA